MAMTKQFQYIHYHNQYTVTIVLCVVGPLRPSKNSIRNRWKLETLCKIYPLLIYANIYNMIVGFSISFVL